MSASPVKPAPIAPYVEDCDDDEKAKPLSAPPVANSARKVTRRDEASDSGYSSHTYATGSSSQSSRKKVPEPKKAAESKSTSGFFSKLVMGKNKSANKKREEKSVEKADAPKAVRRHSLGRSSRNQDLRAAAAAVTERKETTVESRPTIAPLDTKLVRTTSVQSPAQSSMSAGMPRAAPVVAYGPPLVPGPPQTQHPDLFTPAGRPRPYSYHAGVPMYGPPLAPYYIDGPFPPPVMMPPGVHPYPPPAPAPVPQPYNVLQPGSPTNRVINYNMAHTAPPLPFPSQGPIWGGSPYPYHATRRGSLPIATRAPIVQYPRVPAPHYGPQRSYTTGYITPMESPEEYDTAIYTQDDEQYYRDIERRERDRRSMPPPPVPQRPTIGRAATTSMRTVTLPRNKRHSIEPVASSPRKQSFDEESSRPAPRPNPTKRNSQSSDYSTERIANGDTIGPSPPSPILRRRSRGLSRPTSYHESHDKYQAAEAYQDQNGTGPHPTVDAVQKALRERPETKQSRGTRSTRSHSSRGSSKSSDPKRQYRATPAVDRSSEKTRERNALDAMALKLGRMVMDAADGDVSFRMKSAPTSRSRDGRNGAKERSVKYLPSGSTNSRGERGEVEVHRSRSHRHGEEVERSNSSRHRSRSHVRRRPADENSAVLDGDPIERVRSKAEGHRENHSRRSSRSRTSSRRPALREEI